MKKIRLILFVTMVAAFAFIACSNDDADTENPQIVVNSPSDHAPYHMGDEIHFDAEFSDNVALKQIKIDIHFGEGHDHKSAFEGNEWHWDTIADLSDRHQHVQFQIGIPQNTAPGEYHFIVFCTDEAGNESYVPMMIDIEDEDYEH